MSAPPRRSLRSPHDSLRNRLEMTAFRLVTWPIRLLSRRAALGFGAVLGRVSWKLGVRRGRVLASLRQALPEAGPAEHRRIGEAAAAHVGRTVAEFLRFAGEDRRRVDALVALEGLEPLRQLLAKRERGGALVVTGHLGAWALYVTALAAAGIPAALLVGKQRNPYVDELILGIPGDAVRFISKGRSAPRHLLASLQEGRVVVMVADHYSSAESVWAPFLGRSASTLPLPGTLVERYGLPLFLMVGRRQEDGTHRVHLRELAVPEDLEGDALRHEVAVLCNRELGRAILEQPEQYWWYHARWKVRGVYRKRKKLLGQPPPL